MLNFLMLTWTYVKKSLGFKGLNKN